MTGDERREQLLQTAIELFSQHGFNGTTTRVIAKAADVSEATLFKHFASKEDLYEAILQKKSSRDGLREFPWEVNPELIKAFEDKDDHKFFYTLAKDSLDKQQKDIRFMRIMLYSALEDHNLSEQFFLDFVTKVYEFISQYIESRQRDGAMRDINPRIVVRSLLGMLIHHSLNNILWDKDRKLLDISNEEAAENFAGILLKGVLTK